jgi:hypothetical protein
MANLTIEHKEEFNKITVDQELLQEGGFAFYLNEGFLHQRGLKIEFDRRPDGTVQLYLLATPPASRQFVYSEAAKSACTAKWSSIQPQLRP